MAHEWQEFEVVKRENRRELTLGQEIDERIRENGLPGSLFELVNLNYLEIAMTCLESMPVGIVELSNLMSLVLRGNKLLTMPEELGQLQKLKMLDLSNNQIQQLPESISRLSQLQSLNCSSNCLEMFPAVDQLKLIHVFDISNNQLCQLPEGIASADLCHLADIKASHNCIREIPELISELPRLKVLDLSNNMICTVPFELSNCLKLKELDLKGNKLSDQKLFKFANDNHCTTKTVLDYIASVQEKQSGKGKGKGKRKKKGKKDEVDEESANECIRVLRFPSSGGVFITVMPTVLDVRPHIVCCIIRNLNFNKDSSTFKKFIALQTKLHEGVCEQRRAGTIATHDLKLVQLPLVYDARLPQVVKITPLFRTKEFTATELVSSLRKAAEDLRKEKKRNTISGVHKYLDLLKDKDLYPCLVDSLDRVISFPPITNSDLTKMSIESRDMLLEVTGSSLDACKRIADAFLTGMLDMDVTQTDDDTSGPGRRQVVVEQVKVFDRDGGLRTVYPSRTDLQLSPDICIIRD